MNFQPLHRQPSHPAHSGQIRANIPAFSPWLYKKRNAVDMLLAMTKRLIAAAAREEAGRDVFDGIESSTTQSANTLGTACFHRSHSNSGKD